jgi:thioredoxin reductase
VKTSCGTTYTSKYVIAACGMKEFVPDIPGVELADMYGVHDTNRDSYKDKRVLIIGKGNSAFETATHLLDRAASINVVGPTYTRLAWNTHYVGSVRILNAKVIETHETKSADAVIPASIGYIKKEGDEFKVLLKFTFSKTIENPEAVVTYDKIIVCTGFKYSTDIFDSTCKP